MDLIQVKFSWEIQARGQKRKLAGSQRDTEYLGGIRNKMGSVTEKGKTHRKEGLQKQEAPIPHAKFSAILCFLEEEFSNLERPVYADHGAGGDSRWNLASPAQATLSN